MALDFAAYLNVPAENVEAAKPLPAGHFHADIASWKGAERDYKNGEPPKPVVEITFRTTGPDTDVDETELPSNGGVGVLLTRDYGLVRPTSKGKVEGGGQSAIIRLAENLGLDTKGMQVADVLDALKGQSVRVYNEPRPDKKQEGVFYNNVTQVLPPA